MVYLRSTDPSCGHIHDTVQNVISNAYPHFLGILSRFEKELRNHTPPLLTGDSACLSHVHCPFLFRILARARQRPGGSTIDIPVIPQTYLQYGAEPGDGTARYGTTAFSPSILYSDDPVIQTIWNRYITEAIELDGFVVGLHRMLHDRTTNLLEAAAIAAEAGSGRPPGAAFATTQPLTLAQARTMGFSSMEEACIVLSGSPPSLTFEQARTMGFSSLEEAHAMLNGRSQSLTLEQARAMGFSSLEEALAML